MILIRSFIQKFMSSPFLVFGWLSILPNNPLLCDSIQHTIQVIDEYFVLVVHFSIIFFSLFVVDGLTNAHTVAIFLLHLQELVFTDVYKGYITISKWCGKIQHTILVIEL